MNKTDDIPIYSASIFYYDFDYKEETSMLVQQILESYCFFPPERINAGKLTNESYQLYTEMDKDILVKAYSESDVLSISMGSEDSIVTKDFWKVNWNLTFHKWSERKNNSSFKPWNVLTLLSSHTRLNDSVNYNNFFNCFFRLIEALSPFYASIDDVKNGIKLRHSRFVSVIVLSKEPLHQRQFIIRLSFGGCFFLLCDGREPLTSLVQSVVSVSLIEARSAAISGSIPLFTQ